MLDLETKELVHQDQLALLLIQPEVFCKNVESSPTIADLHSLVQTNVQLEHLAKNTDVSQINAPPPPDAAHLPLVLVLLFIQNADPNVTDVVETSFAEHVHQELNANLENVSQLETHVPQSLNVLILHN